MTLRTQSLCKINVERPAADLLIFPTLVTLSQVFVINGNLEKIATSLQGLPKPNTYVLLPL